MRQLENRPALIDDDIGRIRREDLAEPIGIVIAVPSLFVTERDCDQTFVYAGHAAALRSPRLTCTVYGLDPVHQMARYVQGALAYWLYRGHDPTSVRESRCAGVPALARRLSERAGSSPGSTLRGARLLGDQPGGFASPLRTQLRVYPTCACRLVHAR
jgi:hypothetical protein